MNTKLVVNFKISLSTGSLYFESNINWYNSDSIQDGREEVVETLTLLRYRFSETLLLRNTVWLIACTFGLFGIGYVVDLIPIRMHWFVHHVNHKSDRIMKSDTSLLCAVLGHFSNIFFVYKKCDTLRVSRDRMRGEEHDWLVIYSWTKWNNQFLFHLYISQLTYEGPSKSYVIRSFSWNLYVRLSCMICH